MFMILTIGRLVLLPDVNAQICNPDPTLTAPGIYPDTLLPTCIGVPYDEVITFIVPVDTVVTIPPFGTFTLPIDSITLDDVINMPPGMTYGCNPGTCVFPGNSSNCILFSGTPTASGTYDIQVAVTAFVTALGNPIASPDTISLYTFTVYAGITDTLAVVDDCGIGIGSVNISTNGTSPFLYLWNNGQTTSGISGLTAGGYDVIVTDGNGCTDTLEAVVGNTGAPEIDLDTMGFVGCFGDAGGFIDITVAGGTAPYGFSWSNGDTTQNTSGLVEDAYVLTITDANGCSVMETFNVEEPALLEIGLDGVDEVSCFGLEDGAAEVTATGGIGSHTYAWNTVPQQTGRVAIELSAGTYTVIATDENGCADTLEVVVEEPDSLALTLTSTNETISGANDGTASAMAMGGTGMVTYNWSNGETGAMIDSLAPGTYIIEAVDENGCETRDSVIIEMGPVSIEPELAPGFLTVNAFPNPGAGILNVEITMSDRQALDIRLLDITGRLLYGEEVSSSDYYTEQWNLTEYGSGTYLLIVRGERGTISRRIIVLPR